MDGVPLDTPGPPRYFLLNKPPGYLTTLDDPHGRPTIMDLFKHEGRCFPVGRLDLESRGLILLTNNGFLANRMTHPSFGVDKTYVVRVKGRVAPGALKQMRQGVDLEEGRTSPARVKVVGREGGLHRPGVRHPPGLEEADPPHVRRGGVAGHRPHAHPAGAAEP